MNRERAKELLPIIQAFAEGKDIQARYIEGNAIWGAPIDPSFIDSFEYRIKPEPKIIYVNKYTHSMGYSYHKNEEDAHRHVFKDMEYIAKKFQEVLDD